MGACAKEKHHPKQKEEENRKCIFTLTTHAFILVAICSVLGPRRNPAGPQLGNRHESGSFYTFLLLLSERLFPQAPPHRTPFFSPFPCLSARHSTIIEPYNKQDVVSVDKDVDVLWWSIEDPVHCNQKQGHRQNKPLRDSSFLLLCSRGIAADKDPEGSPGEEVVNKK